MKWLSILCLIFCSGLTFGKTPQEQAQALVSEHDMNQKIWEAKIERAKSDAEVEELMAKRPDTLAYSEALLKAINPFFKEDWSLPYMSWLLRNHPSLTYESVDSQGNANLIDRESNFLKYVDRFHVNSLHAGEFAVSLMFHNSIKADVITMKLTLCEKIYANHANKNNKVMGAAALACAHFSPYYEEDWETKKKILGYYKLAVLHASDIQVGDTTVGKIVEEKLHVINNLDPGRPVPLIVGFDALTRKHELAENKGKSIVLVFWGMSMPNVTEFYEQMNKLEAATKDKNVVVLGVTSEDVAKVRTLIGQGVIKWRDFMDPDGAISKEFRVNELPFAYIIEVLLVLFLARF
jgi:peroxiredoxin